MTKNNDKGKELDEGSGDLYYEISRYCMQTALVILMAGLQNPSFISILYQIIPLNNNRNRINNMINSNQNRSSSSNKDNGFLTILMENKTHVTHMV